MNKLKVFISSVQSEFSDERKAVHRHLLKDPFISKYFEPVMFEELPASSKSADTVYLQGVERADIYLVLIGKTYGNDDEKGISPTEKEFDTALQCNKEALAFIKDYEPKTLETKERRFLKKIEKYVTYKRFAETYDLLQEINRAFVSYLQEKGYLLTTSFDATLHPYAKLHDIDKDKIDGFIAIAHETRNFPLRKGSTPKKVLTHLDLFTGNDEIINSALLVFSGNPQKYFPTAVVKCAQFHGTRVEKPIPDHRVIKGDVFEQVNQAVDFVLAKTPVSVGTRAKSNQAPVAYEIPRPVVAEAIVNAIAHREYNSRGSVEVWLFQDRLEVKNPGQLPRELNVRKLEKDHGSYPYNPRLAEVLYQAGYIERFGTGTGEIFRLTAKAGLKKPVFDLNEGVKIIIYRPGDQATDQATDQVTDQANKIRFRQIDNLTHRLLLVLDGEMSRRELMDKLELKHRPTFRSNYLNPAHGEGLIEMTNPDKPTIETQKYRLTLKGKKIKKQIQNEFR